MPKSPTGVTYREKAKRWEARLIIPGENGKKYSPTRRAKTQAEAKDLLDELKRTYLKDGGRLQLAAKVRTFAELADYYQATFLKPAEYHTESGRKTGGLRSWKTPLGQLNRMRVYFGKKQLRTFSYATIQAYQSHRINTISERTKKQLSITSVNRELALLRRMFNVAFREQWVRQNPMLTGESLISVAAEHKRERIITRVEENRLLKACDSPRRQHLKGIVIAALDTGMRQGEILSLVWDDVDLDQDQISIKSTNTKTAIARNVPITPRLKQYLESIHLDGSTREYFPLNGTDAVFTSHHLPWGKGQRLSGVKTSFNAARKDAGLEDLRFHDLRHTAATRMVRKGMALSEVGKILGHTEPDTTYRYVNADHDTIRRAARALTDYEDSALGATDHMVVHNSEPTESIH